MKSYRRLKIGIVVLLFCAQGNAFTQSAALPTPPAGQSAPISADTLLPKAVFNLLAFTGTNSGSQITLSWKTDSRSQFVGFTLERSFDENVFTAIDEVVVNSSNKTNSYTYVDGKPTTGRNFYRLKMTDSSGSSTYSAVISVTHVPATTLQIRYDSQSGNISLAGMEAGATYQLKVYNCNGQIALQKTATTTTVSSISIGSLPHGLYVVYATDGTAAPVSQKIIW